MFPFLELSEDVRQHIVTYLGVWEFLPLTLTGGPARQDVEDFSKRELCRIAREHAIDNSWWDRVGLDVEGQNITARFSFRRSLRNAYRTQLYSLEQLPWDVGGLILSMHPDGKHMLSANHGPPSRSTSISVWDLSSKQCIRSFNGGNMEVHFYAGVGFSAGHIVIHSIPDKLSIWSMDGECKHVFDLDDLCGSVVGIATASDLVYVAHAENSISVIDPRAGTLRSMEQLWRDESTDHVFGYGYVVKLCVYNNYLVILRPAAEGLPGAGVYVVDRDSWRVESYHAGDYKSMAITSDGDFALDISDREIQLFQLRDGHLDFRRSIRFPVLSPWRHCRIKHGTKSRFFVKEARPRADLFEDESIAVYNALNGVMERRLCHPSSLASTVP